MKTNKTIYNAIFSLIVLLTLVTTPSSFAEDKPYINTRVLSATLAQQAVMSAYEKCRSQGYQVAVTLVDRSGKLMTFIRDPLAGSHTIDVSQGKAYTSATFQSTTSSMMDMNDLKSIPHILLLGGGLPIRVGGHFYGAIGVSGAPARKVTGDIDEECAQAGLDTIAEAIEFAD